MEQKMGGSNVEEDCFPIGMRVLAVDDDPICLKILKTLLRKCEYHVTTTNQAITALRMLRENRNRYDLVISDVNMPDMDGFRLLELVGLEMDLPVIMLSAHSDTELVMKGITHGACDYLLKPVRIEEIRNIWQHVLRRKKPDSMDHSPNPDKADQGGTGPTSMCRDKKMKRKEKIEDAEEEVEDNGHENVDSSAQKKSRVIWSVELHGKFVAAVNQLGLDKAVPKKILDLMNVEELTREKVASHLQKYRLFLRKLRSEDSSHLLHTGSADSFEDFRTFTGPQRLSSASLSSYQPGGMLGRLNSSAALSRHGISSGVIQPGPSRTLNNPINGLGTFQPNQNGILFQGIPTSTELNQLSRNRSTNNFGEFNRVNDPNVFGAATIFQDSRVTFGALPAASGNPLLLQANTHQTQHCCGFRHQSSLGVPSLNQEPFDMHVCGSCSFLDHGRCNQNWQREVQLSNIPSNLLSAIEPFNHEQFPTNNLQESISWNSSHLSNSPVDLSSPKANSASLEDSSGDICHAGPSNNNAIQNMDYTTDQQWVDLTHDYNGIMNHTFLEGGTSAFGTRFRSNEDFPFENIP